MSSMTSLVAAFFALVAIGLFCPAYAMPQLALLRRIAGAAGLAMSFVLAAVAIIFTAVEPERASESIVWGLFAVCCAVGAAAVRPNPVGTSTSTGATSTPAAGSPDQFPAQPGQEQAQQLYGQLPPQAGPAAAPQWQPHGQPAPGYGQAPTSGPGV